VIKSFKCRETEKTFNREFSKKIPKGIQRTALRKLRMLNRSVTLNDLRIPPSNHLEALKGNRKGQHSIRIKIQWRVCFVWKAGDAHDVEIVDYH